MSITQNSKIQVRSGLRANLPQLAQGELAWSVDDQTLWIGNGNVANGAPVAGVTQILTTANLSEILPYSMTPVNGNLGTPDGTTTTFYLPVTPVPNTLLIWKNFPLIPNDGYTQSGNAITFSTAPVVGDKLFYQCQI